MYVQHVHITVKEKSMGPKEYNQIVITTLDTVNSPICV